MPHEHVIQDMDVRFVINPITRVLTNLSIDKPAKTTIAQYDHNSERFTFELPRYIENHDMTLCDRVEVHYINTDGTTKETSEGCYIIDDLRVSDEDEEVAICSWLLSGNATKYVGVLRFVVRFACTENNEIVYLWNTAIFKDIIVTPSLYCSDTIVEKNPDVFAAWEQKLRNIDARLPAITVADDDKILQAVNGRWTAIKVENSVVKTYVDDYISSALGGEY